MRGQGLVEFALILPILLLLLFGIIDMGWMIFNFSQLYNAVREGTRYGSVAGFNTANPQYTNCDKIRDRITQLAGFSGIKPSNIWIMYDDGRPYTGTATALVGGCGDTSDGGTVTYPSGAFQANSAYAQQSSATYKRPSPLKVENGDRIVIHISVSVHFLTPFIAALARDGVTMNFVTARSVFPSGLAAQLELAQAPQS
jgi:hypothetical protein